MDQKTPKAMTAKDYKRAGREAALTYIKSRKAAKGEDDGSLAINSY